MQSVGNLCRPRWCSEITAGYASPLCGRGRQRLWHDAQLLKQCEIVHQEAAVFPFAVYNPVNDDASHGDPPASCGDSHEGAVVCAVERETGDELLTLRHLLLVNPLLVRKGGKQFSFKKGFQAVTTGCLAG